MIGKRIRRGLVLLALAALLPLTVRAEEGTVPTGETAPETMPETTPVTEPTTETEPLFDTGDWNLYFGQLHAHTADSDGQGTVEEAFSYAAAVEGLDFFAVTDHSDSFDNADQGGLNTDGASVSQCWAAGKAAAAAVTDGDFVGIYGFEMTWNQGQGHISTFATPGWLSREQETYRDYQDGLENYYDALLSAPESISQFNHPGELHGDFKEFAYRSDAVDALVTLIEVGSGAGSEYVTAYDAYTLALDEGWHLAPTNNQNNHTGSFGDAGENRTVILAAELTEQSIYDVLRNYRVYATEDRDLGIYYTLDGYVMGSELSAGTAGEAADIVVRLSDPTDPEWGTVEVVTQGGKVVSSLAAGETVTVSLPTTAPYYYIRVVQADGDIAVTAPVWLRQRDDLGIASLNTKTDTTRAGQEQTILLELYNREASVLTVTELQLADDKGNILFSTAGENPIPQFGTSAYSVSCSFPTDGLRTVTATVRGTFEGRERTFTEELKIVVLPAETEGQMAVTEISQVRTGEPGRIYCVQGLVTAGTANVHNTFRDTIYVQDDTGGIAVLGYSATGLELGRRVKVTGTLGKSEGNPQLELITIEVSGKEEPVVPSVADNALDYATQGGQLLKLTGRVMSVTLRNGAVQSFTVKDEAGNSAKVWVESYIRSGSLGENSLDSLVAVDHVVSAVGICHMVNGEGVLRVRDCDEVVLLQGREEETEPTETTAPSSGKKPGSGSGSTKEPEETMVTNVGGNAASGDVAYPGWAVAAMALSMMLLALLKRTQPMA